MELGKPCRRSTNGVHLYTPTASLSFPSCRAHNVLDVQFQTTLTSHQAHATI